MVLLKYRFSTSEKYKDSDLRDGPMWALVFRLVFQATRTLSDEFAVFERSPSRSSGSICTFQACSFLYFFFVFCEYPLVTLAYFD